MRITVAYIATSGGKDAVALGVRLARSVGAALDLCMVLPDDPIAATLVSNAGYDEVLESQAREWLTEAAALVPSDVEVATHASFHESFGEGIIAEATRLDAAMIVVGGSGGGLIGGLTLGSVVNDLLHSAPVPVALAPRGFRHSKVSKVREVTAAIGTRPGAPHLLDTAVALSKSAGVPLRLVSLVAFDEVRGGGSDEVRRRTLDHAAETLDTARAALPPDFPVSAVTVDGATVEGAINDLEWHDGDLIMVGSSRLGQPRRIFLGTTAAKMLRVLAVPMLVVPREEAGENVGG